MGACISARWPRSRRSTAGSATRPGPRRWRAGDGGRRRSRRRLWRGAHYAYDDGGATSSDSVMADQLAGQWYADATGLGDLVAPARVRAALRTVHELNVVAFGDGLMGAVNGMRRDGRSTSRRAVGRGLGRDHLCAGRVHDRTRPRRRGLGDRPGAAAVTYERGLWFRTPEAYDRRGNFRASLYLRPLAIWAIEEALRRRSR